MPAKVTLFITSGPLKNRQFDFEEHDTLLFGRRKTCHAQITGDPRVSRHHFILEVNPPDVRIRDIGSRNGTIVNGVKYGGRQAHEEPAQAALRQYPAVDLKHGDFITVGRTRMLVQVEMPEQCTRCGAEFSSESGREARKTRSPKGCPACQDLLVLEPTECYEQDVPRCNGCGKDVSAEPHSGCHGEYFCRECRKDMVRNTDAFAAVLRSAAAKMPDSEPVSIEGYDLREELGRGGMGVVYRAIRRTDAKPVAVKLMLARVSVNERARKMFLREIEIGSQLQHPNLVRILHTGAVGSAFYCVMDLCRGGSLADFDWHYQEAAPLSAIMPAFVDCLSGLAFAHRQGVVHRDLKPHNILLDRDGSRTVSKISDFGLAKLFQKSGLSGMTATGATAGTFFFMPREQLTEFKYARPASDVWSIAATFYAVLAKRLPREFPEDRDPIQIILESHADPIRTHRSDIPKPIADVIDRALLLDVSARYQDAGEMLHALQRAL